MSSPVALAVRLTGIPPTTFIRFPQLPPELRIMIWKLALHRKPRIIVASKMSRGDFEKEPEDTRNLSYAANEGGIIETHDTSNRVFAVDSHGQVTPVGCTWDTRLSDHAMPTALLHTCRESRQQALKIYEIAFVGLESSSPGSSSPKHVYFDWTRDELMVDDARAWKSFCGRDPKGVPNGEGQTVPVWLSKIQHLSISCGFSKCVQLCEDISTGMAALKTLSILGHPCGAHRGSTRQCGLVGRRKTAFTLFLESKLEQKLGQENQKGLPKIIFTTWSDFYKTMSSDEIDFQAPRRRTVALWEYAE